MWIYVLTYMLGHSNLFSLVGLMIAVGGIVWRTGLGAKRAVKQTSVVHT